ncbi:hypothetical protein H257_05384 [Aphanomyces astaci]|uniref:Vacuolar protein sorting-associated protein 28 homolog n=2 Tax=Aphanomyces astaci TaxID=112090 RepID=W4GSD6_APHAT|nr:hypothetical protein H257_05384 [Aphanomyces astaci]ETV81813.1 hypothetical protein H257_05384 [Aphanomyces astaci]|eukprot:XP_009828550.1 hypothetical protein H257_05384 [Aphanomyces astaci]
MNNPPSYAQPPAYAYTSSGSIQVQTTVMSSSTTFAISRTSSATSISSLKPPSDVKLFESAKDRRMYEDMSDLYAIIKTTEHLETAYVRDAISPDEYTEACTKLISQYKTAETALRNAGHLVSIDAFLSHYRLDCPRAVERLVRLGVPATVVHNTTSTSVDAVNVAQTVQHFITLSDALKMNIRAVDEVQPLLSESMGSLTKVKGLPPTFDGLMKLEQWLRVLNAMRASDELDEDQTRQLSFDLEQAYTGFMSFLNKSG